MDKSARLISHISESNLVPFNSFGRGLQYAISCDQKPWLCNCSMEHAVRLLELMKEVLQADLKNSKKKVRDLVLDQGVSLWWKGWKKKKSGGAKRWKKRAMQFELLLIRNRSTQMCWVGKQEGASRQVEGNWTLSLQFTPAWVRIERARFLLSQLRLGIYSTYIVRPVHWNASTSPQYFLSLESCL